MKSVIPFLLLTGCAGTQHALEAANAKLDQAKAIVAEAEAKRTAVCESALDTLRKIEAVAPFACGLVAAAPDAPALAKQTCVAAGDLPAAVKNVELACSLGK
jgi:gamma-glutamyl phosphate reductase